MNKKNLFSGSVIGGSSLLVIFSVLCLTVFTMLALGTVQAESRIAEASARSVTDYYRADLEAEQIFASLRSGRKVSGVTQQGEHYCYSCAVSEKQELLVELRCSDGQWSVISWQTVVYPEITTDDAPSLWDGF